MPLLKDVHVLKLEDGKKFREECSLVSNLSSMRFKTEADHNLNCNTINSSPIFSLVHVQETKDAKMKEKRIAVT